MKIESLAIPDVNLIHYQPFPDRRGLFVETYETKVFSGLGLECCFVQDALSRSIRKHTFRGMHFQRPPYGQPTLVRVSRGRLLDVVVDIRASSPTFGHHVSVELNADDFLALYIPVGFAHGFCTLVDDTEVSYKLGDHYAPEHSMGINLADTDLGIEWPVSPSEGVISEKDQTNPRLRDLPPTFT